MVSIFLASARLWVQSPVLQKNVCMCGEGLHLDTKIDACRRKTMEKYRENIIHKSRMSEASRK
jgi:hypothetical protein